ncbi:MAG: class I SAM-dependent rRNA methyltransferase [Phycisphaeraceae bacterium]|nr:class I SAM-dependent rRNA methyltransferase [Phycisphaerae bacterium]MBX3391540.1 class I SAM-dependent rRNA methyltransferase [Phycisphaeraceae bacterium]
MPDGPSFEKRFSASLDRRAALFASDVTDAMRLFNGHADGIDGVYVDRYGPGAVLILHDGRAPESLSPGHAADDILRFTSQAGVRSVYIKPFARDRSGLGGAHPESLTEPTPAAGEALDQAVLIREYGLRFEVRLYDGYSTGLFLDQRENRRSLAARVASLAADANRRSEPPPAVLNTFSYTGAFSVACAAAGAATTSVDISPRYLEWAKRNFRHNGINPDGHRFARMDTFEFFAYANRKGLRYDLIILDPPSFSAANRRRKIPAWSSIEHYPRLIAQAVGLLSPGGLVFASTNTRSLTVPGRLERLIEKGLGRRPRSCELPQRPLDFAGDPDALAAVLFSLA